MGLNELAVKVARMEERVNNLEEKILDELMERKGTQKEMQAELNAINKKVWMAAGFLAAAQLGLQVFLKWVFK